jgi:alpha-L-fucosidase
MRVGYIIFTVMQGTRFLCAPNEAFSRITGYGPGEACSKRDLIAELAEALSACGIPLLLYFTGDGAYLDHDVSRSFGYWDRTNQKVSESFVTKWAEVAREYSLRYGTMIKGWWIDGCHSTLGYDDSKMKILGDAVRAGNPDALVAFNNGVGYYGQYCKYEDFTAGEANEFEAIPETRFAGTAQWHVLSFLGLPSEFYSWGNPAWGAPGSKYTSRQLTDYVKTVNSRGGVVSIDVCTLRDGTVDFGQMEILTHLGQSIAADAAPGQQT